MYITYIAIFHKGNCLYKCKGNLKKKKIGKTVKAKKAELNLKKLGKINFQGKIKINFRVLKDFIGK